MAMNEDIPVIVITSPKILINFSCAYCSKKYATTDIKFVHTCKYCNKEQNISNLGYGIDSISFYMGLIVHKLSDYHIIKIQYIKSYILIADTIVSYLQKMGMRIKQKKDNLIIETSETKKTCCC